MSGYWWSRENAAWEREQIEGQVKDGIIVEAGATNWVDFSEEIEQEFAYSEFCEDCHKFWGEHLPECPWSKGGV